MSDILMPALSPTMTEGKLARWLKKPGDPIAPGDVITSFADKGILDIKVGVQKGNNEQIDLEGGEIGIHAAPTVTGDVVIVGSSIGDNRADPDRMNEADPLGALQCGPALLDQFVVDRARQAVVLLLALEASHLRRHRRPVEDPREIQPARLPVLDASTCIEQIAAPDQGCAQ